MCGINVLTSCMDTVNAHFAADRAAGAEQTKMKNK